MSLDNLNAMYKFFEEKPGDLASYGAMADDLDAMGYAKLAHAFRWMCYRNKFPHLRTHYMKNGRIGRKIPAAFRWAWYSPLGWNGVRVIPKELKVESHVLPLMLRVKQQQLFVSHQAAVMWLADQLKALRDVYEAQPPKPPGV